MYDRAERKLIFCNPQTGDHLGPGVYDVLKPKKAEIREDGYAPFGSLTGRDAYVESGTGTISIPGPGRYDPQPGDVITKSCASLQFTEPRFKYKKDVLPGPADYKVPLTTKAPILPKPEKPSHKVKLARLPAAPSIPVPGQAYGFEETEEGTLVQQNPPDRDISLGPAFYNPLVTDSKVSRIYRGNFWSKMSCNRNSTFDTSNHNPGPGDYNPVDSSRTLVKNVNVKGDEGPRSHQAYVPRHYEEIEVAALKQNVPPPNNYNIRGQFDPKATTVDADGYTVEHPPFGQQSKRFIYEASHVPGPGAYNDPRSALAALKKVQSLKQVPFGQTSIRFDKQRRALSMPGPTSYNLTGLGAESMKKAYLASTQRGVFGSTAPRIQSFNKRDLYELPGPSQYQTSIGPPLERKAPARLSGANSAPPKPSAPFASTSKRDNLSRAALDQPAPGQYDVAASFQRTHSKRDPAPPRNPDARRRRNAFQSSASRFAFVNDIPRPDLDVPAPTNYDVRGSLSKIGGHIDQSARFQKLQLEDLPGPGAYQLSPLFQDTVLKATFNSTLGNVMFSVARPTLKRPVPVF